MPDKQQLASPHGRADQLADVAPTAQDAGCQHLHSLSRKMHDILTVAPCVASTNEFQTPVVQYFARAQSKQKREQVNMRCGGTDLPSTRVLTPRGPISVCHEGDRKMKHRPPPDGAVSILCGDTDKTSPGRRVLPEGAWPEPRFTCSAFLLFSLLGFVRHSIFRSPLLSQQRYWVPSSSTNRTGNTSRCRRGTGKE